MLLSELLKKIEYIECLGFEECEIVGVTERSGNVSEGFVFVAVEGNFENGERYINVAYERGAFATVVSSPKRKTYYKNTIIAENPRKCEAEIAKAIWGENVGKVKIIGITGTKGKTTTAKILAECIAHLGLGCVSIGTLGVEYYCGKKRVFLTGTAENTTPDAPFIYKALSDAYGEGVRVGVIEVSSQALMNYRVFGIPFTVCVFTNFSHDHVGSLEHKSVGEYLDAKRSLFCDYGAKICIVNSDDESSRLISGGIDHVIDFGNESKSFKLSVSLSDESHSEFTINGNSFSLSLGGDFNAYNAAAAVVTASMLFARDVSEFSSVLESISVPGRYEVYRIKDKTVIIDFAHNGESFRSVITSAKKSRRGKVITLFGSVGERSHGRRAELAIVAEELSDFIVLTADNPGCESAEDICEEIASYMIDRSCVKIVPDRREAIKFALDVASDGDVVLLLGKGHENYQLIGKNKIPFSEREIIESLGALRIT